MTAGIKANVDGSGAIQVGGSDYITISSAGAVAVPQTLAVTNSVSAPNTFGYKNRLINGNMAISQRGASFNFFNNTTTQYGIDRWYTDNSATGTGLNVTPTTDNSATYGGPSYINLSINSIANAGYFSFAQRIESKNSYDLSSASCTLSFTAALTATGGTLQVQVLIGVPTALDTYTTVTFQSPVVVSVTGTPTRFSVPFTAPATAYNGLLVYFKVINNGTTATTVNFNLGTVQLEKGTLATAFDVRPYSTELALCQRYYYRMQSTGTSYFYTAQCNTTTTSIGTLIFPVTMRVAPTTFEQTGTVTDYQVAHSNTNTVCSAVPTLTSSDIWGATTTFTVAAGLTQGRGSINRAVNSAAYLGWGAEL